MNEKQFETLPILKPGEYLYDKKGNKRVLIKSTEFIKTQFEFWKTKYEVVWIDALLKDQIKK